MPPTRPLLVFDGACGFCRRWIVRWRRNTGDRVDYAPFQEVAERFPEITREPFSEAVHLIEPDGRVSRGAEAVFRLLTYAGGSGDEPGDGGARPGRARWLLALYHRFPGFAPASEWAYRLVADHRPLFDRLTGWIWGTHVVPPGERWTAWIFLRVLGAVSAIAFASLWVQIHGLAGHDGVLPARSFLADVAARYGPVRFWFLPTVFWLGATDGVLAAACGLGVAASLLLMIGVAPILCLALSWLLYLSLSTVCRDFLWFQWDGLLLETLFLALFLAPASAWSRPSRDPPPRRVGLWLLRWLLFRLMVASAAVKLTSGDPTWRNLTALEYHYETQCLPPWTAWYAHHFPAWVQRSSAVAMFTIEGLMPFLIVAPRRIRFAAAGAMAGLQLVIALTGNYGFFNLITIALCLLLLDDGVWWRPGRGRRAAATESPSPAEAPPLFRRSSMAVRVAALTLVLASVVPTVRAFQRSLDLGPLTALYRFLSPLRTINSYGLFAVMTTTRPEIVLEGSMDGSAWMAYEFRYKPGDLSRRPEFVAPHQPRLDWQMWFAALDDYRNEAWFLQFCERLLQGSRPVLALMDENPFPRAPRFLRAVLYVYHFTSADERRGGPWWRRELRGLYCPVLTLQNGRLAAVGERDPGQP